MHVRLLAEWSIDKLEQYHQDDLLINVRFDLAFYN